MISQELSEITPVLLAGGRVRVCGLCREKVIPNSSQTLLAI